MSSNHKSRNNIIAIRPHFKMNIGLIFFAGIFIYLVFYLYIQSKQTIITGYQVKNGTLAQNRQYTAIALRNEKTYTSEDTGYINFYIREGERIAVSNQIYAIDESGKLSEISISDPQQYNSLTEMELNDLKQSIQSFAKSFDPVVFTDAKIFEQKISGELSKIENRRILEDIDAINAMHINDIIKFFRSTNTGVITYYEDGYEQKKSSDLTAQDFNKETYTQTVVSNDDLIEKGNFVYKLCNDENWSLCILVSNEELARLSDNDYVKVKFSKNETTSWAQIKIIKPTKDGTIVELNFSNSMVSYARDRYVDIELLLEENSGLKIPNSSIVNCNFFLIDKAFVSKGGNSTNFGVNRKIMDTNGNYTAKFVEIEVYYEDDDYYYVSMSQLNSGDVLLFANTSESTSMPQASEYTIGKIGSLQGVYNINKGFADFKKIDILYSNDEYSIINAKNAYGLRAYDYIALDAANVTDKDFVY